jgi:D-serine deaminase-like pyridoxal phosphate-dependent protein
VPDSRYSIADTSQILSPGLVIFRDLVEKNFDEMVRVAGNASRLRPHCKTHKMREIAQLQLARGIAKHKCATIAEAEMLAEVGVKDIFLAYNPVGPNIGRVAKFVATYPDVTFTVTADHPGPIAALGDALASAGKSVGVLLDIDCGQHRTGIEPGAGAWELYRYLDSLPGLAAGGLAGLIIGGALAGPYYGPPPAVYPYPAPPAYAAPPPVYAPAPGYPATSPVYVPPRWAWNGYQWVWQPGHWRYY